MSHGEVLKLRISNALELLDTLKSCNVLLSNGRIDDFYELHEQVSKLFGTEDSLSKSMRDFDENHTKDYKTDKSQLVKILENAYDAVKENEKQLSKIMKSIIEEQKEHDTIGNAVSKYYPSQKNIPKFIDLKS